METKKFNIVNSFTDVHTKERYTTDHEPVDFSVERVAEIRRVEDVIGYKLIEEVKSSEKEVKETKKSKKENKIDNEN